MEISILRFEETSSKKLYTVLQFQYFCLDLEGEQLNKKTRKYEWVLAYDIILHCDLKVKILNKSQNHTVPVSLNYVELKNNYR